jgi:hypothetical protein
MTLHWWHVTISYVLVLGGFAALTLDAALRHARAKRLLAALETRRRPAARGNAEGHGELNRMPASDDRSAEGRGELNRMAQS